MKLAKDSIIKEKIKKDELNKYYDLSVENKFIIVAFMPVLFNLILILVLILFNGDKLLLTKILAYGILISGFVQLIVLVIFSKVFLIFNYLSLKINLSYLPEFFKVYSPIFFTTLMFLIIFFYINKIWNHIYLSFYIKEINSVFF